MAVDPQEPDSLAEAAGEDAAGEEDVEAPEADAAEQRAEVQERRDAPLSERLADEVNPADAAEQARIVELNEDEYR